MTSKVVKRNFLVVILFVSGSTPSLLLLGFLSTCTFIFQGTTGTIFIEVKRGHLWKTPFENLSQVEPRARQA